MKKFSGVRSICFLPLSSRRLSYIERRRRRSKKTFFFFASTLLCLFPFRGMKKFLQKFSCLRSNCCLPFSSRRLSSSSLTITIVNKYHDHHGAPISISTLVFPDGDGPISVFPDVDTTAIDASHVVVVVDDDAHISIPPVSGTTISSCKSHGDDFPISGLPDDDADTSTTHTSYDEDDLPDDDAATSTTHTSYDEDDADAPINKYKSHDDNDVDDAPISISPVDDPTPISTSHDDDDARLSISAELPDDILCEIFHRLPLESCLRLKWVSKSWHSLITHQTLPEILQTQFIGFFHCGLALPPVVKTSNNAAKYFNYTLMGADDLVCNGSSIDLTLSFLPSYYQWVLASRNGLLLCLLRDSFARPEPSICVCNPCTKSWTKIPFNDSDLFPFGSFRLFNYMFLDFDPSITPHYKVIALFVGDTPWRLRIYHSETGRMEEKQLSCGDHVLPLGWHHNCALWNGSLYIHGYDSKYQDETMRFRISDGDVLDLEYVKFPKGTRNPISSTTCIGIMGGELCFARLNDRRLRVWTVRGEHENRWVLKHDGTVWPLSAPQRDDVVFRVLGFHPLQRALFILCGNEISAYDLHKKALNKICQIGSEAEGVARASFYPYFSCSPYVLESRNVEHDATK